MWLRIWGWSCYPGLKDGPNAFTGDLEKRKTGGYMSVGKDETMKVKGWRDERKWSASQGSQVASRTWNGQENRFFPVGASRRNQTAKILTKFDMMCYSSTMTWIYSVIIWCTKFISSPWVLWWTLLGSCIFRRDSTWKMKTLGLLRQTSWVPISVLY